MTYHNPNRIDLTGNDKLAYIIDGKRYDVVKGELAKSIRNGDIKEITVEVL